MRLIKKKTNINFLGQTRRKIALAISVLVVVVSLYELAVEGLEFGIDFTGGILLEVGYPSFVCPHRTVRTRTNCVKTCVARWLSVPRVSICAASSS